jgi:hypothetical protein
MRNLDLWLLARLLVPLSLAILPAKGFLPEPTPLPSPSPVKAAAAGDDRFGFCTHFTQGWPPDVIMPQIAASGAAYIRDDWPWWQCEVTPGATYQVPAALQHWLDVAYANGLKVVVAMGSNGSGNGHVGYADPYDPAAYSKFAAWLAAYEGPRIYAIEVGNEPNNDYKRVEGANWESLYVALLNKTYVAVKAAGPSTLVIGVGSQGQQVFDMLATGVQCDGLTYHPYPNGIPAETTYEPPYTGTDSYPQWIAALRQKTNLPFYETEWGWGTAGSISEYDQANLICRRFLQSLGLGVEHTFIYKYADEKNLTSSNATNYDAMSGVTRFHFTDYKQSLFVLKRIIPRLNLTKASGEPVKASSSDASFVATDFYGYVFQRKLVANVTKALTVAAVWIGNGDPRQPVPPKTCTVSFPVPHSYGSESYVLNPITNEQTPVSRYPNSLANGMLTVTLPISDRPLLILVE